MIPKTIGIIGGGMVGRATARAFMEWAEVRVFDLRPELRTHWLADVLACGIVFVCLPTPQTADGMQCDLSAVENFFEHQRGSRVNFVLKSTVPVGTTDCIKETYKLVNIVHSPEFLTARCSLVDAQIPARNIVGQVGETKAVADLLETVYHTRFPSAPVYRCTSDESEFVKLMTNSFFAAKVAFFNEMRTFADHQHMDWRTVIEAVLADGRISPSHTKVPGPTGFGFSGTCLPKDIASMTCQLEARGLNAAVCRSAHERNAIDRKRT